MYCGLVMLRMRRIAIQFKKGEIRVNVRASAVCQPIDAANNNLIELLLTRKIRIKGVNGRNGVDGEPGTIRSHVGNLVGSVKQEPMCSEFSEYRLA